MFCPLFGCCTHQYSEQPLLSPTCLKLVTVLGGKHHVKPAPCKTLCPDFLQLTSL